MREFAVPIILFVAIHLAIVTIAVQMHAIAQ